MTDNTFAITPAALSDTLSALRAWWENEHDYDIAEEQLSACCRRLFATPPAPPLPADLVAALRAWRNRIEIHNDLYPEVRRLADLADRLFPPEPPHRCFVPDCTNTDIGPWSWHIGSGDTGRHLYRDACYTHGKCIEALLHDHV
jgi:hypothetical protein